MFSFFVPGKPRGKGRPRHLKDSKHTYTDDKTRQYEELVRTIFMQKYSSDRPVPEKMPVAIFIIACYKQPKNFTKADRAAALDGTLLPTVKPDGDNIAKIIGDSLNGLAYCDDNQVTDWIIKKRYAISDDGVGVKVMVFTLKERPELFEVEEVTGFEKEESKGDIKP